MGIKTTFAVEDLTVTLHCCALDLLQKMGKHPKNNLPNDGALRIQVCPKKGISPTILFWGCDLEHQSYEFSGGVVRILRDERC